MTGALPSISPRYRIERVIGAGGFAIVYQAHDEQFGRTVAIKVMGSDLSESVGRDRFRREIQLQSRLQHPHIVPLFDSGEADGRLFYVMPYVAGESLRQRLQRERRLSVKDVTRLAREVGDALHHAHQAGVVHRDVKPENILIAEQSAMVADFGIARPAAERGGEQLTMTGMSIGTPAYMSPEQVDGSAVADARSDIYSLACVLYECLTGEAPFSGNSPQSVMAKHLMSPAPSARTLRADLPGGVDAVFARALAKTPADRHESVRAFVEDFAEALSRSATTSSGATASLARPDGTPPQSKDAPATTGRTAPSTFRVPIALSLGIVAVATAIAVFLPRFRSDAPTPAVPSDSASVPMIAVLALETPDSADRALVDGMTEELTSRLSRIGSLGVLARASLATYDSRGKAPSQVGKDLGVAYLLAGTLRAERLADGSRQVALTPRLTRVADDRDIWSERYTARLLPGEMFALQTRIATQVVEQLRVALTPAEQSAMTVQPTDNWEAYDFFVRGNVFASLPAAEEPARLAVDMFERAVGADPRFVAAWAKLAEAHSQYYFFFDRTPARAQQAVAALRRAVAIDSTLPEVKLASGFLRYWVQLDYDGALADLEAARRAQPNNSQLHYTIGSLLRRRGDFDAAIASYRRAAQLNPRSQLPATDLGSTYLWLHRFPEADRELQRAITLVPDWSPPYMLQGFLHLSWTGDTARARGAIRAAMPRLGRRNVIGGMASRWRYLLTTLGGDLLDGVDSLALGSAPIDSVSFYLTRGELRLRRGQGPRARIDFDSALVLAQQRAIVRTTDPNTQADLANAYAFLGRRDDAIAAARRAEALLPLSRDAYFAPSLFALLIQAYITAGAYDLALDKLELLRQVPSPVTISFLLADPHYAPLHNLPRFKKLVSN